MGFCGSLNQEIGHSISTAMMKGQPVMASDVMIMIGYRYDIVQGNLISLILA